MNISIIKMISIHKHVCLCYSLIAWYFMYTHIYYNLQCSILSTHTYTTIYIENCIQCSIFSRNILITINKINNRYKYNYKYSN